MDASLVRATHFSISFQITLPSGRDPAKVMQTWMLDQSLVRRIKKTDIFTVDYMRTAHISIPGFSSSGVSKNFVPCVCPGSRVWLNWLKRFATPNELLKIQGLWLRPCFDRFDNKVKMQACGNAFSGTVAFNLQISVVFGRF